MITGGGSRPWLGALVLTALGAVGCSSTPAGVIPAVPAAGTVTYKGKPLEQGQLQFLPEQGSPASGSIENGKFTLSTYSEGDGAVPGKHKVGITSTKEVPSKRGGEAETVYLIPVNYASPDLSGIEVEIPPEGNTNITIDLK
jgi:hypothetical protein